MTFWAQSKKQCMVKISYWNTINFKINTGKPCIRNSYKFNNTGLSKVANLNNWAGQDFSLKRYSIIKFRISICCVFNDSNLDNPCEFLSAFETSGTCPTQLTSHGLPCTCPFNPSAINLPPSVFHVRHLDPAWLNLVIVSIRFT